jgi:hypothetical protein
MQATPGPGSELESFEALRQFLPKPEDAEPSQPRSPGGDSEPTRSYMASWQRPCPAIGRGRVL